MTKILIDEAVARQTLEALFGLYAVAGVPLEQINKKLLLEALDEASPAYWALRQALEQPAQDPTHSQDWQGMDGATAWHLIDRHADGWADVGKMMSEWLEANKTAPQAPAGYAKKIESLIAERDALKAKLAEQPAPAQPLTDEQIEEIAARTLFPVNFARAIEAAHGIKGNT